MGKIAVYDVAPSPSSSPEEDPLGASEGRLLADWITPALGEIAVRFGPVDAKPPEDAARQISLTLLGITPAAAARASSRDPPSLRLLARYLVTTSAPERSQADQLIVALAFAALERGVPELERDGPSLDLWQALGLEARPALVVRAIIERQRSIDAAPLVRRPMVTQWSRMRAISGRVSGPGGIPIAGARIEVASTGLTAHSDHRGQFTLTGVPSGPPDLMLVVTAKGVRLTVPASPLQNELLKISVPLPES